MHTFGLAFHFYVKITKISILLNFTVDFYCTEVIVTTATAQLLQAIKSTLRAMACTASMVRSISRCFGS